MSKSYGSLTSSSSGHARVVGSNNRPLTNSPPNDASKGGASSNSLSSMATGLSHPCFRPFRPVFLNTNELVPFSTFLLSLLLSRGISQGNPNLQHRPQAGLSPSHFNFLCLQVTQARAIGFSWTIRRANGQTSERIQGRLGLYALTVVAARLGTLGEVMSEETTTAVKILLCWGFGYFPFRSCQLE